MALLAEELVEEWLNRQGYFTIRGIKVGVDEIDLLAMRFGEDGSAECRHIEVQASMRPVSYITAIPKKHRKDGRAATSAATRSPELLKACVREWVEKKFTKPKKTKVIKALFPKQWRSELVVNNVKFEDELAYIRAEGIEVMELPLIIEQLNNQQFPIQSASGADFADLIQFAAEKL